MKRHTASMIAAVLALPPAAALAADAVPRLAQACAACHGVDGNSANPARYPNLAAQRPAYLALQLANFKSGERPDPVMMAIASSLTGADMRALAVYFGAQRARPQPSSNRGLEQRGRTTFTRGGAGGAPACASCHGADAHGRDTVPRVASQPGSYTLAQLRMYKAAPAFRNPLAMVMKGVAVKLSEEDMASAAAYLATLP